MLFYNLAFLIEYLGDTNDLLNYKNYLFDGLYDLIKDFLENNFILLLTLF